MNWPMINTKTMINTWSHIVLVFHVFNILCIFIKLWHLYDSVCMCSRARPLSYSRYLLTNTDNKNFKPIPIRLFSLVGYQTDTDNERNTEISIKGLNKIASCIQIMSSK